MTDLQSVCMGGKNCRMEEIEVAIVVARSSRGKADVGWSEASVLVIWTAKIGNLWDIQTTEAADIVVVGRWRIRAIVSEDGFHEPSV